jgi:hypothetical protein
MLGARHERRAALITDQRTGGPLPGGLIRQVAGELAGRGLNVEYPVHVDSCCLTVTGLPGWYCSVEVSEEGYVLLEYWPAVAGTADPAVLAAQAMRVLGGPEGWRPDERICPPGQALIRAAGLALRSAGLAVALDVHADEENFEICTQLAVTRPGRPDRGEVSIGEDGALSWECDYPHGAQSGNRAGRIGNVLAGVLAPGAPGLVDC